MKQDEIENKKKAFLGEKIIYDNLGQYIWAVQKNGHHQKLADLRGWGAIQNLFTDIKDAEKFQDEIGELIAKTLHDHLLSKKPSVSDEEIRKYANGNFGFDSDSTNLEHAFCSGAEWMRDKLSPQVVQSEVSEEHLKQLRDEIEHIFDSGANELRVYEMVKTFIERRYLSLTPPDAEKWISVEERLPETKNGEFGFVPCLVFFDNGIDLVLFNTRLNIFQDNKYITIETVTHWMPLPKPPINKQGGK